MSAMPPAWHNSVAAAHTGLFTGGVTNLFPCCVPELTDGVVLLRAHSEADFDRIIEQCQDSRSLRWTTIPRPYDETCARQFFDLIRDGWDREGEGTTTLYWAVAAADEPERFLGSVDLMRSGRGSGEVGFGLHPAGRGRGLMARAVRLVLAEAQRRGISPVRWRADVGNWPSRRVAWACGFRQDGVLPSMAVQSDVDGQRTWEVDGWIASWRAGEAMTPRHPWYVAPELRAPGLVLRPWQVEDGAALPEALDEVTDRFLPGAAPTRASYEAFLARSLEREASGTGVAWAITDEKARTLLGGIHLFDISHSHRRGDAALEVFVLPSARGSKVFERALPAVLDHAFAPVEAGGMGLARVHADADVANSASVRAMLRAGMTYVGMALEAAPDARPGHEDERVDMCVLQALASDDRTAVACANVRRAARPATIHGAGVLLREFTEDDAAAVMTLMREPEFGSTHLPEAGEREALRWITQGSAGAFRGFTLRWAVCPLLAEGTPGSPVGFIRAFRLEDTLFSGDAEIGYFLHSSARRKGLASAAARALTDYLLTPAADGGFGLRRVTAFTSPENIASQKVLMAAGLTHWSVESQVVENGSYGVTRSIFQGDDPSPDRWRYGRLRDAT